MNLVQARIQLLEILEKWELDPFAYKIEMVDRSEEIEMQLDATQLTIAEAGPSKEKERLESALNIMSLAHIQNVLPLDIPKIKELLTAEQSHLTEALKHFNEYWDGIDYTSRQKEVDTFWGIERKT